MSGQSYQDLTVWQKAIDLVASVYRVTDRWPKDELYGLTNQLRRAVVSVPANVAEGQGRYSSKEFLHHLSVANGSLYEVETHLVISQRLGFVDEQTHEALLNQTAEVGRLLHGLMRSLRQPTR